MENLMSHSNSNYYYNYYYYCFTSERRKNEAQTLRPNPHKYLLAVSHCSQFQLNLSSTCSYKLNQYQSWKLI